jgi:hypothetical protein
MIEAYSADIDFAMQFYCREHLQYGEKFARFAFVSQAVFIWMRNTAKQSWDRIVQGPRHASCRWKATLGLEGVHPVDFVGIASDVSYLYHD